MAGLRVCMRLQTAGFLQLLLLLLLSDGAPLPLPSAGGSVGEPQLPVTLLLVVSLSALLAVAVALLNCVTCCKEREIDFKEFEDNFEDEVDFTPPAEDTPSMQSPAEVYTLAVPPLPMPGPPHLQLPRTAECSTGPHVARHNLSYIQEIGSGWFGKVLLSEIYSDPSVARVVVKELKANASSKEQNDFLQLGDPYRVLQHPNILHCFGQCVEAIPFLLIFEYCDLGDLRSYAVQHDWLYRNGELLQLQKMACEIAAGLTHLHKHNFLHSDLALRNCYLTTDMTVKIGDYGFGPSRFKEDYIITEEDQCVALRWLAPELVGELHGGVITSEQTKPSNVWALGVTLWELFERGTQPYTHLSDKEVLHHVIRDQQIKLPKPQLELPYSERWFEVLQFCWLPADKRATAEEIHRLLTYLRMQGQKEIEDDFEQRWSSLKPNPSTRQTTISHSSFPILDQFDDGREPDEVLTVTETSHGLSFEYVWEAAKHDHYDGHNLAAMETTLNYHSMFFPVPRQDIQTHFPETGAEPEAQRVPGTLPVFDARERSSRNEYYIQLEERGESETGVADSSAVDGVTPSIDQHVVLQDIKLDESSTDADFFHQSIDSKDSFLQDSLIWSSSDRESPFHANIFSENDSKLEEPHSFHRGFMELPELSLRRSSLPAYNNHVVEHEGLTSTSVPGLERDAVRLVDLDDGAGVRKVLNTENLVDNYMFLHENSLMKGNRAAPERASSHRLYGSDRFNGADDPSDPPVTSSQLRDEFLDLVSPILKDFLSPLKETETPVPSDVLSAEENRSIQQSDLNGSSIEEICSESQNSSPSTSEVVRANPDDPNGGHQFNDESATTDALCSDANTASLERPRVPDEIRESLRIEDLEPSEHFQSLCEEEDQRRNMSDDFSQKDLNLAEHAGHGRIPQDVSSQEMSDPCLDQISQDSLLEDSVSFTLTTVENSAATPDSLDSLDMHGEEAGHGVSLHTPTVHKLQAPYKTADSGYETENLESPEWNSQVSSTEVSKEVGGEEAAAATQPPPEIVVSDVDCEADVQESGGDLNHGAADAPVGGSYRDSAYFSDNEELDRRSDDVNGTPATVPVWTVSSPSDGVLFEEHIREDPEDLQEAIASTDALLVGDAAFTGTTLPELVVTKVENGTDEESDDGEQHLLQDGTQPKDVTPPTSPTPSADAVVHAKLTRTYAGEGHKKKEPDMEGRYLGRRDGTMSGSSEDAMDADEEDENSDDSDDDAHAYRLHSSGSESEEEDDEHPVPVIVSDNSDALNLRSLLKPKTLQFAKSGASATENKRTVCFFDDVTVYLFDQETPTKELGDHTIGSNNQVSEFSSPVTTASYLNRFTNSESSTDEEGGAFEWDDDFTSEPSFLPKASNERPVSKTSAASHYFSPPPASRTSEQSWSSLSTYSRFSISPANIASFSLTHVTDSDIEQGGSSEDGEKD